MEVHYLPGCCFCLFRPSARWENIFMFPNVKKRNKQISIYLLSEVKKTLKNATNQPNPLGPPKTSKQTNAPRHKKTP